MNFVFVTLFPEQIEAAAGHSMLKRAMDTGIIRMECVNPRDFSLDHQSHAEQIFRLGTAQGQRV